ncbi:hypothetical protein [Pseudonocardia sp.]|uniref:hypothetical protein n=1 Tax=Pseudonocardia sp. TaxID=60912 RepID=UPI003D09A7D3
MSLVTASAEGALPLLRSVAAAHPDLRFELVVVQDGGEHGDLPAPAAGETVRVATLARRFGSYAVLCAGLATARGDAVVVADAARPDAAAVVAAVLAPWRDGHDVVWAASARRGVRDRLPGVPVTPAERRPSLLVDRSVLDAVQALPRRPRDIVAAIARTGTRQATATVAAQEPVPTLRHRAVRTLGWLAGLYAAPFLLLLCAGLLIAGFGAVVGLAAAVLGLVVKVKAWTLVVASVLVVGGLNLSALGGFGEYLWRTGGARERPGYVLAGVRDL